MVLSGAPWGLLGGSLGAPWGLPWASPSRLGADVVEIYVIGAPSGQILWLIIVEIAFMDVKVSVFIENWSDVDSKMMILLQTWCVTQVMPNTFPRVLSFEFVRSFRLAESGYDFLNSGTDSVAIYRILALSGQIWWRADFVPMSNCLTSPLVTQGQARQSE